MSIHPTLTLAVYIGAAVVFCLVLAYMFFYNRTIKIPRGMGETEAIAMATMKKEREGRTGRL
jgi:beta-lactam-binding protein with PASTA domain